MDLYHIWCDLKPGVSDVEFAESLRRYLLELEADGRIAGYRLTRRKLGLGPRDLGEFHVAVEVDDLAQLEQAFHAASTRSGAVEALHAGVNQFAENLTFALYRDFPDRHRERGGERF